MSIVNSMTSDSIQNFRRLQGLFPGLWLVLLEKKKFRNFVDFNIFALFDMILKLE